MYDYDDYKMDAKKAWEDVEKDILEESCAGGACSIGGAPKASAPKATSGSRIRSLRNKAPSIKKGSVVMMEDIDGTTKEVVVVDVVKNIKEGRAGFHGFYMDDTSKTTWGFNEDVKVVLGTVESLMEMELNEEGGGTGSVAVGPGGEAPSIARVKTPVGTKPCENEDKKEEEYTGLETGVKRRMD